MPIDDDDNDNNNSDSGSDWTENNAESYETDEEMLSSSDDEFLHVHDHTDHWGDDNAMDPNEFVQELTDDTERQNAQYRSTDNTEAVVVDDVMDWTTTSDNNTDDISQHLHSWPSMSSYQALRHLQFNPFQNVSLINRIVRPRHTRRTILMNSFRNMRSQQSRGYFYPSFPERRWSFSHLP
ncbi:hypothetical protein ACH3XW_27670 [Acanthocheilonema viteae]